MPIQEGVGFAHVSPEANKILLVFEKREGSAETGVQVSDYVTVILNNSDKNN